MSEAFDLNLDDLDDFVFEPNAWDLAFAIGIGADEDDREALDELVDAMLIWGDEPLLERLTGPAVDRLWNSEFEGWIREGLVRLTTQDGWEAAAASALADFDHAPREADVTKEVARNMAMQLGNEDHPVFFCLDCLNEAITNAEPSERRALACRAAILARRNAAVPDDEVQAALAAVPFGSPSERLGTVERRQAVRRRLGRLGEFARESMSALSEELLAIANEPLPECAEDDDAWAVVGTALLAEVARPALN